jgi:hypothetical protein
MATIEPGGQIEKDPDSLEFKTVDWGTHLATGVEIATSEWEVTGADTALTATNPARLTGNRSVRARLEGGTVGVTYTVRNRIVTNETPSQTKDASFSVLIVDK